MPKPELSDLPHLQRPARDGIDTHRPGRPGWRPLRLPGRAGGDRSASPAIPEGSLLDRVGAGRDRAARAALEFLIKVEASGAMGPQVRSPGARHAGHHPGPARSVHLSADASRAPIPLHRRRDRHRADASDARHIELARVPGRARCSTARGRRADFPYLTELRRSGAANGASEVVLTVTREVGTRWRGERGRIAASRLAPLVDHPETLCFVCGPAAMVDRRAVDARGPRDRDEAGYGSRSGSEAASRPRARGPWLDLQRRFHVRYALDAARDGDRLVAFLGGLHRPESVTTPLAVSTSIWPR